MTLNEIMNLICFFLAAGAAAIGVFHRFFSPKFFKWTQIAYDLVTISCLYYAVILLSVVIKVSSLDIDNFSHQTDPAQIAILASFFLVRISHIVEKQWGPDFQVRTHGHDMVIKTKITLPDPVN